MIYYKGENFDDLVKDGITLVDFYADWCGPCKMLGSVLETIDDKEVKILKVNVDEYSDLANRFKIMSIPYLLYIKDGKEISNSVGFIDKGMLEEKLNEVKSL